VESDKSDILIYSTLGSSSEVFQVNGIEECSHAALNLASQAIRRVCIFSHDLSPQIYNQAPFLDAIKQLAIRNKQTQIRILLQDSGKVEKNGHRLIQLWRRLTSKIEIRCPHSDYIEHKESFMLADDVGYLHRRFYSSFDATVSFNSRLEVKKLTTFFNEVWEKSEPNSELRDLHI